MTMFLAAFIVMLVIRSLMQPPKFQEGDKITSDWSEGVLEITRVSKDGYRVKNTKGSERVLGVMFVNKYYRRVEFK